jgi:signal transduction histidine kinase
MDRVKSDFITIASHELRTPLTQVKGYTDILHSMNEESDLNREQIREIISHIIRAGNRLDILITAMLDASQLDTEGFRMVFMETRLEMMIRMAVEPLVPALRERHITWKTKGLETLPPLYADSKRLVQAFTNLIGNSIKYTPDHGSISLEAELVPSHDESEEYIEIVLADQGIGIDPKYHDLIFEKFFRVGNPQLHSTGSTKFKGAGPGLGLPIAKGVIEGHGGKIWVESAGEDEELLPGSQFHIILPLRPPGMEANNEAVFAGRPDFLVG